MWVPEVVGLNLKEPYFELVVLKSSKPDAIVPEKFIVTPRGMVGSMRPR